MPVCAAIAGTTPTTNSAIKALNSPKTSGTSSHAATIVNR
jgi:hypothetical protein